MTKAPNKKRKAAAETHLVEWKESWRDEYLKWLCGFANADGGTLIIGRNDKGEPVGAADAKRLLVDLPNKIRDTLGIVAAVRAITDKRLDLIEIDVEPSPMPINYKGEYHYRSGSTKLQLTGNALTAFLLKKVGRHWDGTPVPKVTARELSGAAFKQFKEHARVAERLPPGALSVSRAELVERLRLTEGGMLKRAALLLFHEDPERWVTGAYVKVGMFLSESDLAYHDEIHGDLFTQMEKTVDLLLTKYMVAWISYQGLQRLETFPIPREALREAVLNALIHKDYSSGTPIQIRVYRDRLRIWNPGDLPPTWTADKLLGPHDSRPPNPDIANTFFRAGLIEAWGRGYEKIREACQKAGAPEPTVELDGGVRLLWKWQVPDDAVTPSKPPATARATDPVADPVADPVERLLRQLAAEPLATSRLQAALGLKHRPTFKENYLRPALADGLIEMTLPDKPSSRLQQYRLTAAGRARLSRAKGRKR